MCETSGLERKVCTSYLSRIGLQVVSSALTRLRAKSLLSCSEQIIPEHSSDFVPNSKSYVSNSCDCFDALL